MEEESEILNDVNDSCLNRFPDPNSTIDTLREPFLNIGVISDLSFVDKSTMYCSLVALVKADHPFDTILQDRAAQFLKSLEPKWGEPDFTAKLITEPVPSSDGSPSGFLEGIHTLLSSPHSTIVATTLSFIKTTMKTSSLEIRSRLVESDLITNIIATVQPQTLQISGNEAILGNIIEIIIFCVKLTYPSYLSDLGITTSVDKYNHCEVIFQKVVLSSSHFVTFLISNWIIFDEALLSSFLFLLGTLLRIGPFHRPILDYVVASPILMALTRCFSSIEYIHHLWITLNDIDDSLTDWTAEGAEVIKYGKWMMQALFSEGFEGTLEQKLMHDTRGHSNSHFVYMCLILSQILGSNLEDP